jgi:subtilase family serine protease
MRLRAIAAMTVVTALTACNGALISVPAGSRMSPPLAPTAAQRGLWPRPGPAVRLCAPAPPGYARCQAWMRTDIAGKMRDDTPSGYGPSDLQAAYNLTSYSEGRGGGTTVAIVDAFDDPNAASDLSIYRAQYGLPPCTASNGCFTKYKFAKATNTGWAGEESLDVDMVSAICPNCKILLVEAAKPSTAALSAAEKYATARAKYVSNSWSGNEGGKAYDRYYDVSGVAITAATGDSGYNPVAQWPAILPSVVGVGGTDLTSIAPRTESAWGGSGSGCSTIYRMPSFQSGIDTGCGDRAQSDVAADASPNTGVAVYDSFHQRGWEVFGGTSVATPIIASVFALAGRTRTNNPGNLYSHSSRLNDITMGNNGNCGAPLCKAGVGWDGPTGLGTPNGIAAF